MQIKHIHKLIRPTVVSLFSGCGGLDLGFHQEGFDLIYACDNDPAAIAVYKRNIDERAHVRNVSSNEFHYDIAQIGKCDVVLGGFPCQGFSKAGPKREGDSRNELYLEMKKTIERLQPRIFLAENVDGLSQNFKGKYLTQIVQDFEQIGYKVSFRIINTVNYGVPQHRRRILFVGVKNNETLNFSWPVETHIAQIRNGESKIFKEEIFPNKYSLKEAVTIRDVLYSIKDLNTDVPDHRVTYKWGNDSLKIMQRINEGQKLCNVRFSESSVYTWEIPEVFGSVDKIDIRILEAIGKNRRHKKYGSIPNGNPLSEKTIAELTGFSDLSDKLKTLVQKGYLKEKNDGYDLKGAMFCSGLFKRPLWDEPSPTVLTNFHNPRYFIHPQRNTPFSLRECARLQGFPDDFIFCESDLIKELENGYRLVGNAVPPVISRLFATSIMDFFTQGYEQEDEVTNGKYPSRAAACGV